MPWPVVGFLFASAATPIFVAWLATRSTPSLRTAAAHPWPLFWASYGATLFIVIATFPSRLADLLASITGVVMALSATHGLGLTWSRGKWRGILVFVGISTYLILSVGFAGPAYHSFTGSGVGDSFILVTWWAVMATLARLVYRRMTARAR